MALEKLNTLNFRNLSSTNITFGPDLNIIIGPNGSGKSSLLEAFFLLGHGKSFRTNKFADVVNSDKDNFIVSGKTYLDDQIGTQRNFSTGEVVYKVNGQKQDKLSDFVKYLAVQIITPESFKLFFGGPKERRKFFDLGLFHVEQSFSNEWKAFSKILAHRNSCLKKGIRGTELEYWDQMFCQYSIVLTELRDCYISKLTEEVSHWLSLLLPSVKENISIEFSRGWNAKKTLEQVLASNREKEYLIGHTLYGAHKFDLKFMINKSTIESVFSRGQQKLFLLVLTLAQASLIKKVKQIKPILLIDDIGAELDQNSRQLLANAISDLKCQTIVTAIEDKAVDSLVNTNKNYKMFHVKHGNVSEISEY